jgi:hypothetical protein
MNRPISSTPGPAEAPAQSFVSRYQLQLDLGSILGAIWLTIFTTSPATRHVPSISLAALARFRGPPGVSENASSAKVAHRELRPTLMLEEPAKLSLLAALYKTINRDNRNFAVRNQAGLFSRQVVYIWRPQRAFSCSPLTHDLSIPTFGNGAPLLSTQFRFAENKSVVPPSN